MKPQLPRCWQQALQDEFRKPYFRRLHQFVRAERQQSVVFPRARDVYNALRKTPLSRVRVVILGQDPYHGDQQAHGFSFSVPRGVTPPPSLKNIFKEQQADLGCKLPDHGNLESWADQGVLLLNSVLTVRAHQAHSHRNQGWETFTDAVIRTISDQADPVVFVLWGQPAQKKATLIDRKRHGTIVSAHPSPLSAHRGFFGSKPFSKTNRMLKKWGKPPIQWCLSQD